MNRQTFDSVLQELGPDALWEELTREGAGEKPVCEMSIPEIENLFLEAGFTGWHLNPLKILGLFPTGKFRLRVAWSGRDWDIETTTRSEIEAYREIATTVGINPGVKWKMPKGIR